MSLIRIDDIQLEVETNARARIDEDVVIEYAERMSAGDKFPPVVLFCEQGLYYLADGFHRTLAARKAGAAEIDADVRSGNRNDALWFALGANQVNGLRPTVADKRHAILLALRAFSDRSESAIAEQIGCSRSYVEKIKAEREAAQDDTSVNVTRRVTGRDGKSYPAKRTGRGSRLSSRRRSAGPLNALKRHWRVASAEDRRAFIAWVEQQEANEVSVEAVELDPENYRVERPFEKSRV
jgi:ParB-like chromosome segregation protein Spo0J